MRERDQFPVVRRGHAITQIEKLAVLGLDMTHPIVPGEFFQMVQLLGV